MVVLAPMVGAVTDEGDGATAQAHPPGRFLLVDVDAESAAVALGAPRLDHRGHRVAAGLEVADELREVVEVVPTPQLPGLVERHRDSLPRRATRGSPLRT